MADCPVEAPWQRGGGRRSNRDFYDRIWGRLNLQEPQRYNTWQLIEPLATRSPSRLEVGPGLHPRLPIQGTHFLDVSSVAAGHLAAAGGYAMLGDITALPYRDGIFDLVCAFDVIEHVADGMLAFAEFKRVLKENGLLIFSLPVNEDAWTEFDDVVGHYHRYEPQTLLQLMARNRLVLESSGVFGMKPRHSLVLRIGVWAIRRFGRMPFLIYDRILYPLALRHQRRLSLAPGLLDTNGVEAAVFLCRSSPLAETPAGI